MASAERGYIEKGAMETRKFSLIFAAFFGLFGKWGAAALAVGIAGLSHIIGKWEEKKKRLKAAYA